MCAPKLMLEFSLSVQWCWDVGANERSPGHEDSALMSRLMLLLQECDGRASSGLTLLSHPLLSCILPQDGAAQRRSLGISHDPVLPPLQNREFNKVEFCYSNTKWTKKLSYWWDALHCSCILCRVPGCGPGPFFLFTGSSDFRAIPSESSTLWVES